MKIVDKTLKPNQYNHEVFEKRIIVIHHTAGGSAQSSIDWWNNTPERVAACVVIDRDGTIYKTFDFDKWASCLGIPTKVFTKYGLPNINRRLDQISIQIELANWGQLEKKGDKFYTYSGKEIPKEDVYEFSKPIKGYKYYEKYSEPQIKALEEFILEMNKKYPKIKLDYREEMWDVSREALTGAWGIWTHVSYRSDKFDLSPQEHVKEMLKNLNK